MGSPIRLPGDAWDLTVGGGSVWVTQSSGEIVRLDSRSARIASRISARPVYFGSAIAYGDGFVFTGNDDERYRHGTTVSKVKASTNRIAGRPVGLGSPQSVAFGAGALWVADHTGYLVELNPRTLKVIVRVPLRFGAHGLVITSRGVFVADAHAARLLRANLHTGRIERIADLDVPPIYPKAGGGFVWASSAGAWGGPPQPQDDRVIRVDPKTLSILQTFRLGGNVPSVGFGFGSLWAADPLTHQVIRISR